MTTLNSINESSKSNESSKAVDVVHKFRIYRQSLEAKERRLKEAELVIQQMKDELKITRDNEKSSRNQLSAAQSRIIQLRETLSKLLFVSDQQLQIETTSQQLEQKIENLARAILDVKEKSKNLSVDISNHLNIMRENKNLKSTLKTTEFEYDLLKIEMQSLSSEKMKQKSEYEEKIKKLENELEHFKTETANIRSECDKTILIYQKQIQENEQIIEEYENERRSLLEDFAQPKGSENKSVKFTCDSTVYINTEERLSAQSTSKQNDMRDTEADAFRCSSYLEMKSLYEPKSKVFRVSSQKVQKGGGKQKPPLEFLNQSQETYPASQQNQLKAPPKRKLFSTNCNHYLN